MLLPQLMIVIASSSSAPPKSTGGSTLGTHSQAPYDGAPHYVLGTEMRASKRPDLSCCIFATGCFWGTEKGFWRLPGVYSTAVGYAQGTTDDPTYAQICQGETNHAEVVQVLWDPAVLSFVDLLGYFWSCHDPTQGDAQGEDEGTQYRSGIYYCTEEQRQLAVASRRAYQAALQASAASPNLESSAHDRPITTEIEPLHKFYFAEDYHQQYLAKPGNRPYCSAEPTGVPLPPPSEWMPSELKGSYAPKLSQAFWAEHGPSVGQRHCNLRAPNEQIVWRE